jgi:threonine dehydrogenase-like Zn-dependent dehydrogenase
MKAVTWHGKRDVRVDTVPDPQIEQPTDAIVKITSTNICGSDLHLYETLGPFMGEGDILGHEPMGIVEEVGSEVTNLKPGDRVVMPFQISCGSCFMCDRQLYTQCETTQVRDQGMGAALFGFSKLYGEVAGGQAEYLRVPQAQFTHIKVPDGPPDERFVYLSDVLPTAWQSVVYADVPQGGTLVVLGLGPIGDMACRVAQHMGVGRVIAVDLVPERLERARQRGVEVVDLTAVDNLGDAIRDMTGGRGPDSVVDAVGMEAHGSPVAKLAQQVTGFLPAAIAAPFMQAAGVDRLAALHSAIDIVRRGGTISLIGVYGGMADPMPLMTMFDKQIQLRMGQANIKRWVDDIMPLLTDEDPLGVDTFATHRLPLDDAPHAYEIFQKKQDGAIKVVLKP